MTNNLFPSYPLIRYFPIINFKPIIILIKNQNAHTHLYIKFHIELHSVLSIESFVHIYLITLV